MGQERMMEEVNPAREDKIFPKHCRAIMQL